MLKLIYLPLHDPELCLFVCPPRDLGNGTSHRRVSFTTVKRFSWGAAPNGFQAYTTRGGRGKVFGTFRQVRHWRPCTHVTLPVTLIRMNLAHHLNAMGTFSKVKDTPFASRVYTIVAIAFYVNGKFIAYISVCFISYVNYAISLFVSVI